MRYAVIDLGTNTFHLLIAESSDGEVKILHKINLPVRLGEGTINEGRIIDAAFERGIKALQGFKRDIDHYKADLVMATATAAVRSAANGQDFVNQALEKAGIQIHIISGKEEANYIYQGVRASGAISGNSLIMDIGGGSTEFILCNEEGVQWKKSFDIGAARLMQGFFKSDPLSNADEIKINQHIALTLEDLTSQCAQYKPNILIGSAGAFETFAGMLHPEHNLDEIKSANIDFEEYTVLATKFITSTHRERANMEGLVPLRVDMIVMAALLTNYVLNITGIKQIRLSTYDLKMGVLQTMIGRNSS